MHRADWLAEAGFGGFMHLLPSDEHEFNLLRTFDTDALAAQLTSARVRYFVLTLGQNSGYFIAPNRRYEQIAGYAANARMSPRDIPMELSETLLKRNIRLLLYLPAQPPNRDTQAQRAFGLPEGPKDQPLNAGAVDKWAEVIKTWAVHYGTHISGWWFDGCYSHVGFSDDIALRYKTAALSGNPDSIVAFNPGVKLIRWSKHEDYTAGELNTPFEVVPAGQHVEGAQWHALTYAGSGWGRRDIRFPDTQWADWAKAVSARRGAITFDVGPNWDTGAGPIGAISSDQLRQMTAIASAMRRV